MDSLCIQLPLVRQYGIALGGIFLASRSAYA